MELNGECRIPVAREAVWAALNDPDMLRACIPGCKALTRTSETEFAARVVSRIGPVSASFAGTVVLSDIDPARSYTISGSGEGGVAGFAKGSARVRLADQPDGGTMLTYTADAAIGGKLASLGGRLLEGASRKTADEFFSAFAARLVAGPEPVGSLAAAPVIAPAPARDGTQPLAIRVEIGAIRVFVQIPWMGLLAIGGWLAAFALGRRLLDRNTDPAVSNDGVPHAAPVRRGDPARHS